MTDKLTIVVTCTDRKSMPVAEDLRIRNLAPGSIQQRADAWSDNLLQASDQRPLRELYQGETWAQVPRLENAARQAGYDPQVLVASAGLGLRDLDHMSPAYGATFSPGHDDSVGLTVQQSRDWWSALQNQVPETFSGPMMWVLSRGYSKVIAEELLSRTLGGPLLVFGGSEEIPAEHRVVSNRSLRPTLGGTANSLNLRMAVRWVELAGLSGIFSSAARARWQDWSAQAGQPDTYNREPMADAVVLDFIRTLRVADPSVTKTRALRQLRDAGFACEQRRFGVLFVETGTLS